MWCALANPEVQGHIVKPRAIGELASTSMRYWPLYRLTEGATREYSLFFSLLAGNC